MKPKFAIIGAGAGGQSMAAILSEAGYSVRLHDVNEELVAKLRELEFIEVTGKLTAKGKPEVVTADYAEVMDGADIVMVTTTADAHEAVGKAIRPYVRDGQAILLNPGLLGGALILSEILRSGEKAPKVYIGEALDLMYACRMEAVGRIFHSGVKKSVLVSAVPAGDIGALLEILKPIFPCLTAAESMLYTSLDMGGPILHVIPTLMNINRLDAGQPYDYYMEGITPHIAELMEQADRERAAVCDALRVEMPTLQEWMEDCYELKGENLYDCIQKNEAYRGVKSPASLDHRFIREEVPAGFVPMASIARELGIATPVMDAFVEMACVMTGIDYWTTGRTAAKFGLTGLSAEEMRRRMSE